MGLKCVFFKLKELRVLRTLRLMLSGEYLTYRWSS